MQLNLSWYKGSRALVTQLHPKKSKIPLLFTPGQWFKCSRFDIPFSGNYELKDLKYD